jgi:hypothetical protein
MAFHGEPPPGKETSHLDGRPANNDPRNLRWETPQENSRRKADHGTLAWGTRNGRVGLSEGDVREIRSRYSSGGATQCRLADEYGISQTHISDIIRRRVWARLA